MVNPMGKAETVIYWVIGGVIGFSVLLALLPTLLGSVTGSSFDWTNITLAKNSSGIVTNSTSAFSFVPFVAVLLIVATVIMVIIGLAKHRGK
jgi:hypothetical protein